MSLSSFEAPLIMWCLSFIQRKTDLWSPEKDGESRSILDWQWCRDSFSHQVQENRKLTGPLKGTVTQIHI